MTSGDKSEEEWSQKLYAWCGPFQQLQFTMALHQITTWRCATWTQCHSSIQRTTTAASDAIPFTNVFASRSANLQEKLLVRTFDYRCEDVDVSSQRSYLDQGWQHYGSFFVCLKGIVNAWKLVGKHHRYLHMDFTYICAWWSLQRSIWDAAMFAQKT
jgi:hypothetical protein